VGGDGVTPLQDVMVGHTGVRKRLGRPADNTADVQSGTARSK